MVNIGDYLLQPEEGWRRYDDRDSNITYIGEWKFPESSLWYNNTISGQFNSINTNLISRMNFTGTKIRIIGQYYNGYSQNVKIKIDGELCGVFTQHGTGKHICLQYEKQGLLFKEHFVEIYTDDGKGFNIDAIDIDVNGELKPYNDKLYKFLIKQNNQYYTIKSEHYSNKLFQPLTLEGGEQPNENDYENFGFDDVNDLLIFQNTKTVQGIDMGVLGEGKYFEVELDNEIKKINNIERGVVIWQELQNLILKD